MGGMNSYGYRKMADGIVFYPPSDPVNLRYPFFDIDKQEIDDAHMVLGRIVMHYYRSRIPVLIHNTGNGYHFIGLIALPKAEYNLFLKPLIKDFKREKCPQTTLRVTPNKYPDEIWNFAALTFDAVEGHTARIIQAAIECNDMTTLAMYFRVVRYPLD